MPYAAFTPEWLNQVTDPYALLGVSVTADDRRILKRYRTVAKQLHPDSLMGAADDLRQFAAQVLPKLVNPAYQRLKQEKGRNEALVSLRFKVRRLGRDQQIHPEQALGKTLIDLPEAEVEVFYEQAIEQLCDRQYASLADFELCTQQLSELNLVYLYRKMGAPVIREKRSGLMASTAVPLAAEAPNSPSDGSSADPNSGLIYAERHASRAQSYLQSKNTNAAIQELKDAIQIDPQNSHYHSLIARAYHLHGLTGMAKVHLKQALRLDPTNAEALLWAKQLNISVVNTAQPVGEAAVPTSKRSRFGGLFSRGGDR